MVKPFIFQIVGFQNSGKTTFLNILLEKLHAENMKTGVIKHHGHGGKPEINETKDSAKYSKRGAIVSLVEGEGRLVLHAEKTNWYLAEQIQILAPFELDFVLIEGHKYESFPKAVIIKDEKDLFLLDELTNVEVVFFRDQSIPDSLLNKIPVPHFYLTSLESIHWTIEYLKSQLN